MVFQTEITLTPRPQGFHLITGDIMSQLPALPRTGVLNLFIQHTACALSLNQYADPAVHSDGETVSSRQTPDDMPQVRHTTENRSDVSAHVKYPTTSTGLSIPITCGHLNLGLFQGIYLCELQHHGSARHLIATIIGE